MLRIQLAHDYGKFTDTHEFKWQKIANGVTINKVWFGKIYTQQIGTIKVNPSSKTRKPFRRNDTEAAPKEWVNGDAEGDDL